MKNMFENIDTKNKTNCSPINLKIPFEREQGSIEYPYIEYFVSSIFLLNNIKVIRNVYHL